MLVVTQYNYLPGACGLCRSSNLPAIDTTIDLDWPNSPEADNPSANHRLYICADCCINLANLVQEHRGVEIRPANAYRLLEELNQSMSRTNVELNNRNQELEKALTVIQAINTTPIVVEQNPAIDVSEYEVVPPPTKPRGKK